MTTDEEFAAYIQDQVCKAFNVKPWEIGVGKAPWYLRPVLMFRRLRYRLRRRHDGMQLRVLRMPSADHPETAQGLSLPAPEHLLRLSCPEEPAVRVEVRQVRDMQADVPGEPGEPRLPGVPEDAIPDASEWYKEIIPDEGNMNCLPWIEACHEDSRTQAGHLLPLRQAQCHDPDGT